MPKKSAKNSGQKIKKASKSVKKSSPRNRKQHERIDIKSYGIDYAALIEEMRPHLTGTLQEISLRADCIPPKSVSRILNGQLKPSLGMMCALAQAAGGHLVVRFEAP